MIDALYLIPDCNRSNAVQKRNFAISTSSLNSGNFYTNISCLLIESEMTTPKLSYKASKTEALDLCQRMQWRAVGQKGFLQKILQ